MDYDFVNDLSEELTCQVCMKLLNEPQLTDCCGQHYCRICLDQWFQQKGKKQCPHCRSEDFTHIVDKKLQRKIREVKVYCLKRKEGCKETMKIEELERHLSKENTNGCGYVTVECTNKDCEKTCLKKDLDNHTKNICKYRKVKCQHCGEVGQYWDINNFHTTYVCPEYPVCCPNKCDTVRDLRRKDLEAHLEVCPLQPVECPFSEAGCEEQLVRKDLDHHIQTNTQQHLLSLMDSHKTLMSKHEALFNDYKELKCSVAGVTTELEALNPRVTDRSVAKSLEKITETLSHASLRLEKEGDQLVFKFSGSLQNWTSPVFQVNFIKMTIVYSQENHRISLVWMGGELYRSYKVGVGINFKYTDFSRHKMIRPSFMTGDLCSRCTKLSEKLRKESKPGQKITQCSLHLFKMSLHKLTCVVTVTLHKHNCQAEYDV